MWHAQTPQRPRAMMLAEVLPIHVPSPCSFYGVPYSGDVPFMLPSCPSMFHACFLNVPLVTPSCPFMFLHVSSMFPLCPSMFHACSLYVPFMSLHVPLMFRSCFLHVPCNVPFISLHVAACAHHVPPCSLHVPFLFLNPVRFLVNPCIRRK